MAQKRKNKQKQKKPNRHRFLIAVASLLVVILVVFLYSHYSITSPNLQSPPLKTLAAAHGIELGVHTSLSRIGDSPYKNIVLSQFSFLTIDGEANWNTLHPTPTTYNYTKVDKLITFAKANNMPVQIHHLLWGEQVFLPDWLKNGNFSQAQLFSIIHSYISSVMGHYKGEVAVWSVANEVFSRAQHSYGLDDWWADHIGGGTTYVNDAFIWAHQTDPNAKLILNDFDNETENGISNAEYNYIKAAKAKGVPIDGIGMQMHINGTSIPTVSAMVQNMQRFAAIGVPTYITEFDVNLNSVKGSSAYKNQLEAQINYNVVTACIESKACVSFDNFGISDKESFLKMLGHTNSHSYLFDSRYRPKPSFYSFRSAWQ